MADFAWQPFLEPGERILWAGQPATGFRVSRRSVAISVAGLVVFVYAAGWTAIASWGLWSGVWRAAEGSLWLTLVVLPLLGLPFLLLGLFGVFGPYLIDARHRARSRYALTDRRALIARTGPDPRLRSLPMAATTATILRPGREPSIRLAAQVRMDSATDSAQRQQTFERIPKAMAVLQLIQQIQAGQIQSESP